MKKQIYVRYNDNDIRVENTWFFGARLYINEDLIDETTQLFALNPNTALLSGTIETNGAVDKIEVFMLALLTTKMQIHVNGKLLAGENFNQL